MKNINSEKNIAGTLNNELRTRLRMFILFLQQDNIWLHKMEFGEEPIKLSPDQVFEQIENFINMYSG